MSRLTPLQFERLAGVEKCLCGMGGGWRWPESSGWLWKMVAFLVVGWVVTDALMVAMVGFVVSSRDYHGGRGFFALTVR
jgi:hypothetical protein